MLTNEELIILGLQTRLAQLEGVITSLTLSDGFKLTDKYRSTERRLLNEALTEVDEIINELIRLDLGSDEIPF